MKKSLFFVGLALLATTVSCNLLNNLLDNPLGGAEINIDSSSDVPAANFVGLNGSQYAKQTPSGDFIVEKDGPQLAVNVDLDGGRTPLNLQAVISGEDLPEFSKPVSGASENAGVLLTIKNPVPHEVVYEAGLTIDGQSVSIPPITLPGNSTTKVFVGKRNDNIPSSVTPDEVVALSGFDFAGKEFKQLTVDKMYVTPMETKGTAPMALGGEFVIDTKYCAGLSFPAGTVLKIHRNFEDLNFSLETYVFDEYDMYVSITNPLPFDVEISATNSDGASATSSVIKAGTPESPVTSQTCIRVKKGSSTVVDDADLLLKFTAASNGAKVPSQLKVKVTVDKLVVVK